MKNGWEQRPFGSAAAGGGADCEEVVQGLERSQSWWNNRGERYMSYGKERNMLADGGCCERDWSAWTVWQ